MSEFSKKASIVFVESGSIRLDAAARQFLNVELGFNGRKDQDLIINGRVFRNPYYVAMKSGELSIFLSVKSPTGCLAIFNLGDEIDIELG